MSVIAKRIFSLLNTNMQAPVQCYPINRISWWFTFLKDCTRYYDEDMSLSWIGATGNLR